MQMKTIEQYKKEFLEFDLPIDSYKSSPDKLKPYLVLVKAFISDYPEEELGKEQYGKVAAIMYFIFIHTIHDDILLFSDELNEFKAYNKLHPSASKSFIAARSMHSINNRDLNYVYREMNVTYAEIYFLCGELMSMRNFHDQAAKEFKAYYELTGDYKSFSEILNPPLSNLHIEDYHCIQNIKIDGIQESKEIYFLGENGVGKTLLLQWIIESVNFEDRDPDGFIFKYSFFNLFAYGTSRNRTGLITDEYFDKTGFGTLFDRNIRLTDVEWWLKDIQRKELLKTTYISLNAVTELLQEVINFDEKAELKIEYNPKADKFVFIEKETEVEFEHIADGYRSVLIWLCDLLRRLTENQPYINKLEDFYGIVLVDEIDMFLHPKWEYTIVQKLRKKLPNIQWFLTTHSPLLVLGASKDAVFYKMYKEGGVTKVSEQWKHSDIDNFLANAILTSPLFDLDTARMREFNEEEKDLDTNSNYFISKIEQNIIKGKEKRRKEGKTYFSDDEVQSIVREAMEKFKTKE